MKLTLENRIKMTLVKKIFIKNIKLGQKDSNLRMSVPKTEALPLGDVPFFIITI